MDKLLKKAIIFAMHAHGSQKRKVKDTHYFWHSFQVARILEEQGVKKEVVIASILHDVVEDTSVTIQDIKENFGERIASLVKEVTSEQEGEWEQRKLKTIQYFKFSSLEAKLIKIADKIDNLEDIKRDIISGRNPWEYFHASKEKQKWYYREMLNVAKKDKDLIKLYPSLIKIFEQAYKDVFE